MSKCSFVFRVATLIILVTPLVLSLAGCVEVVMVLGLRPQTIAIGDYSFAVAYTDRAIRRNMNRLDISGMAVALVDDQEVIWHEEYGVRSVESGDPMAFDTVFNAGSIAKLFTGFEVMRMYEEGMIDLDASIASYLPEFAPRTRWQDEGQITIRQILAHRSGLPRNGSLLGWHFDDRPYILTALTGSLSVLYPAYPPGRRYKYSNIGYDVLGRLIEVVRDIELPDASVVSGFPYYLDETLFTPIGMVNTGCGSEALRYGESSTNRAVGYYQANGENIAYNQFDIINLPSGNLHTTTLDLATFARFVFAEGVTETGRLIEADTLASMFDPSYATLSDPQSNGLTWFTDEVQLGEKVVFHSGTGQGCITMIALTPESKVGVVLMGNSDAFEEVNNQLAFDILELLIETKTGSKRPDRISPDSVSVRSETLESYEGIYVVDNEIVEIQTDGDRLTAYYQGRSLSLRAIDTNRFAFGAPLFGIEESELSFWESDLEGEESVMILSIAGSFHKICPRYVPLEHSPTLWSEIVGIYHIGPRYPTAYSESVSLGTITIAIDSGMLVTETGMYLDPIDDSTIRIVGGIFDGELMDLNLQTRTISWQNFHYTYQ